MSKVKNESLAVRSGIYTIRDLGEHYKRKTKGYWFDSETLKFFRSRLSESLFYGRSVIYFVSSEQGPTASDRRRYSVRKYDPETGSIETVGDFQQYGSLSSAKVAALQLALEES